MPEESARTRRLFRIALWIVGLAAAIPLGLVVVALAVVLIGANLGVGQRFIMREAHDLSGGMVAMQGFGGRFPDALNIRRITISDTRGPWLELDGLTLNWSPSALLRRTTLIDLLAAEHIVLYRKPVPSTAPVKPAQASKDAGSLPRFGVDVRALRVADITLEPEAFGMGSELALEGHGRIADIAPFGHEVSVATLPVMDLALDLVRKDAPGGLSLKARTPPGEIAVHLALHDSTSGYLVGLLHLNQLAPADLALDLGGPRNAARLTGALRLGLIAFNTQGMIDLVRNTSDLTLDGSAPAMQPVPGVSWSQLALTLHLKGPFAAPGGQGNLVLTGLAAKGVSASSLRLVFDGQEQADPGQTVSHVHLTAQSLTVPGPKPDLLAKSPLEADLRVQPLSATKPLTLTLDHPLLHLIGHVLMLPAARGGFDLALPDLKPLAAAGNLALEGHSGLHLDFALPKTQHDSTDMRLTGQIALTGGLKPAVGLIGPNGKLALDVQMSPATTKPAHVSVRKLDLTGQGIALHDTADIALESKPVISSDLTLALSDLKAFAETVSGHVDLTAHMQGPTDDLAARVHLLSAIGMQTVPQGPLTADLEVAHLPNAPEGNVKASGMLDRAAFNLDADLKQDVDLTRRMVLHQLHWNSLDGHGALRLGPGARVPLGDLDLNIARLADFSRLAGQKLAGHLALALHTTEAAPRAPARLVLKLDAALTAAQASVRALTLNGSVLDPTGTPSVDLALGLNGLSAHGVTGQANATARGPETALAVVAKGSFQNVAGAPARLDTALLLNLAQNEVRLDRLDAVAKGEGVRLLGPARVAFGESMGVDHLRVSVAPPGAAPAMIDASGTLKPKLAFNLRMDHVTPALAKPFTPTLSARGTIGLTAQLTGTIARPAGHVALVAQNMGMLTGPAASLPLANAHVTADLSGSVAKLDAALDAGPRIALTLRGTVPTDGRGAIAVATRGHADLGVANAVLGANAMALAGQLGIDMNISGTAQAPIGQGQITLSHASFDNYAQGVRLSDIEATIQAQRDALVVQSFTAHAGRGTIGVTGTVGELQPTVPVDLHITADQAQPITSDLLTAMIGADLRIHGQARSRLDVDGTVHIPSALINIPSSMPASVPQLNVIRPGDKPLGTSAVPLVIGLNVGVVSPGQFYVRGHGLDAEMRGNLHVGGFAVAPIVSGGFDLVRGAFNLAGINLNFTHGRVGFNGAGVNHKLDPTLDFRADRNANGTLASLLVTGYASQPKIGFSSSPSLPQEQVLSLLLFGTDSHALSTTQLAELAAALATLTGGSSFDPLGKIQNALGLDRLAVGGGSGVGNGGTSVEAGKNVMRGVYVGAKQATSGSGTQAQVQIDLTKRLKLNTTVGTGGQVNGFTTPENDPGSSVGLSYEFDY